MCDSCLVVRRDKETGEESKVTWGQALDKLVYRYHRPESALESSSQEQPATTGFADYWRTDEHPG